MTYRGHRGMLAAFVALLLLWCGGLIGINSRIRPHNPFQTEWSRSYADPLSVSLLKGTEGGIYRKLSSPQDASLEKLDRAGNLIWRLDEDADNYSTEVTEQAGLTVLPQRYTGLVAIDDGGQVAWRCQPRPSEYRSVADSSSGDPASFFMKVGVLLYGVSATGEPVWVVNTGNASTYGYGLPSQFSREGRLYYLEMRGNETRTYDENGAQEVLAVSNLPVPDMDFVGPRQGAQTHYSIPAAMLDEGRLLFSDGNDLILNYSGGISKVSLSEGGNADPWRMQGQISVAENGELLVPLKDGSILALDGDFNLLWKMELQDSEVRASCWCDGCWVLLVMEDDNVTQSLRNLANYVPNSLKAQPAQSLTPSMGSRVIISSGDGGRMEKLICIRGGRQLGEMRLGVTSGNRQRHAMFAAQGRVFLRSDRSLIRCLGVEVQP